MGQPCIHQGSGMRSGQRGWPDSLFVPADESLELTGDSPMSRFLWTQKEDIGPSARFGHAMTYDSVRSRTSVRRQFVNRGPGRERQ